MNEIISKQNEKVSQIDIDLRFTKEDILRAARINKEKNGDIILITSPDGLWTCTVCHKTSKNK